MANTTKNILQPPDPTIKGGFTSEKERYKYEYEIWNRTGGYTPAITNLKGLTASVGELNTLVGINTDDSVQEQIDSKANTADLGTIASQNRDDVEITGGTISGTTMSDNTITIPAGSSGSNAQLGGTIYIDTTAVGNVGAGEDTLMTYAVPANTLSNDGDYLEIEAWGVTAANANNKNIKLKIGTTTLLATGAVAANGANWWISAVIARTGASAESIIAKIISDDALIVDSATYTAGTQSTTAAFSITCTGEATANDDIVQHGLIIKWYKS